MEVEGSEVRRGHARCKTKSESDERELSQTYSDRSPDVPQGENKEVESGR